MFTRIFSLCAFFLYFGLTPCFARDTITYDSPINSSGVPLIISATGKFALGFFTPNNGSSHGNQYVGIWYHDGLEPKTIVWVANRDEPVNSTTAWVFGIGEDGNIVLSDTSSRTIPLTTLAGISSPSTRMLKLLDSGNLVLSEGFSNVWQSFLNPTDTFLPGMKISEVLVLTSWRNQTDPSSGSFIFRRDRDVDNQYSIIKNELLYWTSGLSVIGDEILPLISLMSHSNSRIKACILKNCSNMPIQTQSYNYNNTRLVMGFDGKLRFFRRDNQTDEWSSNWSEPTDGCSVFDVCGKSGTCNNKNVVHCKCLPGYKPQSPENWNQGEFSEGCIRKYPVCGEHGNEFLNLSMIKVQKPNLVIEVDESKCKSKCLETCHCQAYSFAETDAYLRGESNSTCSIWTDDLKNFQESYANGGIGLHLRVPISEIENRTCGICGTNIVPYPLSTRPNCGDPKYFKFDCQTEYDTGLVTFNASGRTYRVSRIDQETRRFSIQVEKCRSGDSMKKLLQLPRSSPFFVNSSCHVTKDNFSEDSMRDDKWFYEVEIEWRPPSEPICGSSKDCKDWPDSSCNVAPDGKSRCICNSPSTWDPSQASCTRGVITAMLFILCVAFAWNVKTRRRQMLNRRGNLELSLYNSERRVIDFINSHDFKEDDKKDIDIPHFSLESILIATDNFAEANKLGQGGFGPVYKGTLPRGQEIAIKRLSRGSGQGLEEFKNEVVLIAKLQHRNLVRLLGYCVKGYEKMLIYEYMPNRSLDSFIFDRTRCVLLNWEKRTDIIFGIARGLLYLHQDSRLRIVHRDLKTSNILLDDEMNPKISDFGLARIFGGKQVEANTERVVGTYGYMSPEYALDGFFSIKSDVFSFGVVLLETISGKRNTGFYQAEQPLSLLGYAWRLWKEGRAFDLADKSFREACDEDEYIRCVNVGLLCVQEDPSERPTMSNVLFMLGSETPSLPIPKQPAYVVRRSLSGSASSSSQQQWNAELSTSTLEEGR
ncbi:Receptor-like serine/threonine-protein kinase SD1-8 [Hibiscus syriacus]|uniref:non-specific serine/threonine protein kinase n=1 Tax=Hibiscus syriacus TaxID=106335 RepID=A0A6A2X568_HIBSY|nr:Receptor-like serine/threonine-protein kinase SD1-8 [Hibiscus syriacus]